MKSRILVVEDDINSYLNLEQTVSQMYAMQKKGDLKLKVTHNDTKCNNVCNNHTFISLLFF